MKKLKFNHTLLLTILVSIASLPINAGQLYRYPDENGVSTISKSLPPSAAQNGYDILDDKSLRLIKRVAPALTPEQIVEQERLLTEQKEAQRLAEIAAKKEQERLRQKAIYDKNLLASYQSEQDLNKARDDDLLYRHTQIEKTTALLDTNKEKLRQLQQQAAEQELGGQTVSDNMKKSLAALQQEITQNEAIIERLQLESQQLTMQYEADLIRLRQLLPPK